MIRPGSRAGHASNQATRQDGSDFNGPAEESVLKGYTEALSDWTTFNFPQFLLQRLQSLDIIKPTLVQRELIEVLGHKSFNALVSAEFSSGKTFGICLSTIKYAFDRLVRESDRHVPPRILPVALILCSNRENALQTFETLQALTSAGPVRVVITIGGQKMRPQLKRLQVGCDIVFATPGRLLGLVKSGSFPLRHVPLLVMDEAQSLLSKSFEDQIRRLWESSFLRIANGSSDIVGVETSFGFVSSHYSKEMLKKVRNYDGKRVLVSAYKPKEVPSQIRRVELMFEPVPDGELNCTKIRQVLSFVRGKVIIFANTIQEVEIMSHELRDIERLVVRSSLYFQNEREIALKKSESTERCAILTTDSFAEGIDIPDVEFVIHAALPRQWPEKGPSTDTPWGRYMERNGRTGRLGTTGFSLAFYSPGDSELFPMIAGLAVRARQQKDVETVVQKLHAGERILPEAYPQPLAEI
ncbi:P-loop containing nucleoside triphosphate hydrolase protein [Phyllosticta capitalensis]|uniref:ATP-dependent RNA helicase n=1 Tax=Phyllosticta capitalensis TaxID=121624 RepID=A0ABR1YUW1_9PEZI